MIKYSKKDYPMSKKTGRNTQWMKRDQMSQTERLGCQVIGKKAAQEGDKFGGGSRPRVSGSEHLFRRYPNVSTPYHQKSTSIGLTRENDILVCKPFPAPSRLSLGKKL
ncbi:hypothetical protein TNCV_4789051 [Trichonephila clavipes]|nr:hypothetical protein TNCV_4789051 [Trichonephila clavipes]